MDSRATGNHRSIFGTSNFSGCREGPGGPTWTAGLQVTMKQFLAPAISVAVDKDQEDPHGQQDYR
jgi:hypothetical protein